MVYLYTATQWAAFFSDVEHKVLPVTSGVRIALTYNLYHLPCGKKNELSNAISVGQPVEFNPASFDVTGNALYQELLAALQTPHFIRGGGTLGFYCQHKYANISTDLDDFYPFLKGEDAIVYSVSKSLGLSMSLKPILVFGDGM